MTRSRHVRPNSNLFLFVHDPRDRTWMDQAACRGTNPDLFFPERATNGMKNNPVKKVCAGCPVKDECLRYAMTTPVEKYGIWGGLSDKERRTLRRQRRTHHDNQTREANHPMDTADIPRIDRRKEPT